MNNDNVKPQKSPENSEVETQGADGPEFETKKASELAKLIRLRTNVRGGFYSW